MAKDPKSQPTANDNSQESAKQKEEEQKLEQSLSKIKHKFVILSGKGGVGKSTVAVNLAAALAMAGSRVGLLDVDVHGPSIPRLLNLEQGRPQVEGQKIKPVKWQENLWVMSLGFMLPDAKDAVIWRGPIKMGLIRQFLSDVAWGNLDYLIVDCPPGTGDEPLSTLQLLGKDAQAIIVTTPQLVAIDDVRRSVTFCHQVGNPIFGIVENMSGFVCPNCKQTVDVFASGGGEQLAKETESRFLGRIPLDPEIVNSGDQGQVFVQSHHESPASLAVTRIVKPMLELQGLLQEGQGKADTASGPAGKKEVLAIPLNEGQLSMHFGPSKEFALVRIDDSNQGIIGQEILNPPPHEPEVLPKWLADKGVTTVIASGMGSRAQSLFTHQGIKVIVGAQSGSLEDVVQSYLSGELQTGENLCDH